MATAGNPTGAIKLFYSYSHKDEELRDELEKHLVVLQRQGVITNWHDRRISAGDEWRERINTHLDTAHVILLLISADFLASDYCYDVELKRAMERQEAGEARVVPIILRPVDWQGAAFGRLQALPANAKPVTSWPNRDEAFFDVARGIRAAVEELTALNPPDLPFRRSPLPSTPLHGSRVIRMCDRTAQEGEFSTFFAACLRQYSGRPQLYIVRGAENECLKSLVERFRWTYIQDYANFKWGEQNGAVLEKFLEEWPSDGELSGRRQRLVGSLFKQIDATYEFTHDDFSAAAFARVTSTVLNPIIVIQHKILAARWNDMSKDLLAWYLQFWDEVGGYAPTPQFLVFFHLLYPDNEQTRWWKSWWRGSRFDKERVDNEVEAIALARRNATGARAGARACPCLLMTELACVDRDAVMSWFSQHQIYDDMKIWQTKCDELFKTTPCRSMADIEHELKLVHREFMEGRGF